MIQIPNKRISGPKSDQIRKRLLAADNQSPPTSTQTQVSSQQNSRQPSVKKQQDAPFAVKVKRRIETATQIAATKLGKYAEQLSEIQLGQYIDALA